MPQKAAVEVTGLRVQFGRQVVLPELSVTIPQGQIVGLIGPSGSGKTTLVKAIIGMNPIRSGSITVFGSRIPSLSAVAAIGYMAQSDALYDDLSALDNLLFFGSLYGIRGKEAKKRAAELLEFVDLGASRHKAVKYFSGGMKRRLSLAISLIHDPRLLILDEPTVGIDPLLRKKFWERFESLRAEGRTILVTTHVMDEAAHCDKIMLLREGQIIAGGRLDELLAQTGTATLEDAFLALSSRQEKEAG